MDLRPLHLGVHGHVPVFLGFTTAYERHQNPLMLRESLLVAFFLARLVWSGRPAAVVTAADSDGHGCHRRVLRATMMTAITDNAALTYMGSLVEDLGEEFKIALVAGAVTGGGLTVIANASNPAGVAILRGSFEYSAIDPLGLLIAAIPPTLVAVLAFRVL